MYKNDNMECSKCDYQFKNENELNILFDIHINDTYCNTSSAYYFLQIYCQICIVILIILYKLSFECHINKHRSAFHFVFNWQFLRWQTQNIYFFI